MANIGTHIKDSVSTWQICHDPMIARHISQYLGLDESSDVCNVRQQGEMAFESRIHLHLNWEGFPSGSPSISNKNWNQLLVSMENFLLFWFGPEFDWDHYNRLSTQLWSFKLQTFSEKISHFQSPWWPHCLLSLPLSFLNNDLTETENRKLIITNDLQLR